MKNKKTILGSTAAIAASVALIAGGTFAAWSDYDVVTGNSLGSGELTLDLVNGDQTAATPINFGNLSPGGNAQRAVFIASNNGDSVPDGILSMSVENLDDQEDGCTNANSELDEDPDCATSGDGELSQVINLRASAHEAPTADDCKGYVGSPGGNPGPVVLSNIFGANQIGILNNVPAVTDRTITTLEPGAGVCVVLFSHWPLTRSGSIFGTPPHDNAAHGDSLTFDLRFDLVQAP